MRGYFGIGIENFKKSVNMGGLMRSAYCFGAAFIFTTGRRYEHQSSDTTKAWKTIPYFAFQSVRDLHEHLPYSCPLIGIEITPDAKELRTFNHLERCCYILGSEDTGLSKEAISSCQTILQIPTKMCLNVATTGSLVMYDRVSKIYV